MMAGMTGGSQMTDSWAMRRPSSSSSWELWRWRGGWHRSKRCGRVSCSDHLVFDVADAGDLNADLVARGAEGRRVGFADEEDVAGIKGEEFGDVGDELGNGADQRGGADIGAENVVHKDIDFEVVLGREMRRGWPDGAEGIGTAFAEGRDGRRIRAGC